MSHFQDAASNRGPILQTGKRRIVALDLIYALSLERLLECQRPLPELGMPKAYQKDRTNLIRVVLDLVLKRIIENENFAFLPRFPPRPDSYPTVRFVVGYD
jgi:hypothetical protein